MGGFSAGTNKEYSCSANSLEVVAKMGRMDGIESFPRLANIVGLHCVSTLDMEILALKHLLWLQ